jgi:hypothetical protein
MGTTDVTHMLHVVALEVMKVSIIVTVITAAQSLAITVMIVIVTITGTAVEGDATNLMVSIPLCLVYHINIRVIK